METLFELTIGSDLAEILGLSDRLEETLKTNGFSAEEILDTQLAVEEAITNVIVHGYQKPGEVIIVSCHISRNYMEIQVADAAPQFDPLSVPEPELGGSIEDRRIGGLGVYLIRQIMDEVSYHYKNGWNCLIMRKRRKI